MCSFWGWRSKLYANALSYTFWTVIILALRVGRPRRLHEVCGNRGIDEHFTRGSSIGTVGSPQRCSVWFWPLKCTCSWWRKCSSSFNINTYCAYLKKDILFTLTSTATINVKCIQKISFVKHSLKLDNLICKWDTSSSGICFPVKPVSGKLCRNIQAEYALCIQVQIYHQTECLIKVLLGKDWLSFLYIPSAYGSYSAVSLKFCFISKKDKLGLLCGVSLIWLLVT